MENQPVQPVVSQMPTPIPQSSPPEIPPVPPMKKISKTSIIVLALLFLATTGVAGYFAYQNYQPEQQPTQDQETTQIPNVATKNSCNLIPDPGTCMAYMQSFYYDQKEKKCKEFIWGGCEGVRPFETLKECQSACQSINWKVFKSNVILFEVEAPSDWKITESVIPGDNNQRAVTISSLDFRYEGSEVAEGFALKVGPINDGMEKIESVEQFTSDHPKTFEETEENKKDRYRGLVVVINGILWARYSTSAHTLYDNIPLDVSLLFNPKQKEDARILFGQILSTFKFIGITPGECIFVGCSGTICLDENNFNENPLVTTCEWKKSYGCYRKQYTTCERQEDGECGWTETDELKSCLRENL